MRSILPSSMRSSAARFQLPWVLLFGPALLLPADLAAAVPAVPLWFSRKPSQDPAGESKLRPTIDVCCIIFRFHPASAARFQLPWFLLFGPALSLPSGLAAAVPAVPLWFSRSPSQDPAGANRRRRVRDVKMWLSYNPPTSGGVRCARACVDSQSVLLYQIQHTHCLWHTAPHPPQHRRHTAPTHKTHTPGAAGQGRQQGAARDLPIAEHTKVRRSATNPPASQASALDQHKHRYLHALRAVSSAQKQQFGKWAEQKQ